VRFHDKNVTFTSKIKVKKKLVGKTSGNKMSLFLVKK